MQTTRREPGEPIDGRPQAAEATATRSVRLAAILLAAGRSQRHPIQSKISRPLGGRPLGLHAAQTIATFAPSAMIAVCSEGTREVMLEYAAMGFELAWNDEPGRGLSSSVAIGVQATRRHDVQAVMICLADMPFVSLGHMKALVARLDPATGVEIVGSRACGAHNIVPPAVFGRSLIDRLLHLQGDVGARALLQHAASVEVPSAELMDFDEPKDFEEFELSSTAKRHASVLIHS